MLNKAILHTHLAILTILLALATPARAMRGGSEARDQWPEVVAIEWGQASSFHSPVKCSAVIVADNVLLSAAHCAHGLRSGDEILLNSTTGNAGGTSYRVHAAKTFDSYEPDASKENFYGDIAYIELKDANFSKTFAIRSFPVISREKLIRRERLTAVGLGQISFTLNELTKDRPTPKRVAELQVQNRDRDLFTMAPSNGASPCPGDSGGPVFRLEAGRRVLVGIMVLVHGSCDGRSGYTAVHDTSFSIEWIEKNLSQLIPAPERQ